MQNKLIWRKFNNRNEYLDQLSVEKTESAAGTDWRTSTRHSTPPRRNGKEKPAELTAEEGREQEPEPREQDVHEHKVGAMVERGQRRDRSIFPNGHIFSC